MLEKKETPPAKRVHAVRQAANIAIDFYQRSERRSRARLCIRDRDHDNRITTFNFAPVHLRLPQRSRHFRAMSFQTSRCDSRCILYF